MAKPSGKNTQGADEICKDGRHSIKNVSLAKANDSCLSQTEINNETTDFNLTAVVQRLVDKDYIIIYTNST